MRRTILRGCSWKPMSRINLLDALGPTAANRLAGAIAAGSDGFVQQILAAPPLLNVVLYHRSQACTEAVLFVRVSLVHVAVSVDAVETSRMAETSIAIA